MFTNLFCSTKESSSVNMVLTAVHVAFILFIIVMGFVHGDARNLTRPADAAHTPGGFFPHGVGGVVKGAALVYLSYIGYDAVSTMAEEVEQPARDIPVGVSGSVVIVTALYCLMVVSMSMLLPYDAVRAPPLFCHPRSHSDSCCHRFRPVPPASFSGCWSWGASPLLSPSHPMLQQETIENKASDFYCWTRSTRTRPSRGRSRGKTGWSGCPR
jgi:amino acid transporter